MGGLHRDLAYELNRLAGTLDALNNPKFSSQRAANLWAGTTDLAMLGALNAKGGNLLTANQASGTDALGTTAGFQISGGTPTLSADTGRLKMVTEGTGINIATCDVGDGFSITGLNPVAAGQTITGTITFTQSGTENVRTRLYFWTEVYGFVAAADGQVLTGSGTSTVTTVVPATATRASLNALRGTGVNGSTVYADTWGLWVGAGTEWVMPGVSRGLGLNAICNSLAGTTNLDAVSALRAIA